MSKGKVLVVDDEIEFATTLAERLNIRGYETAACFCTEDALALIHAQDYPNVVLLDLKMPRMDGMETLREIKKYHPAIEVILLTGHGAGIPLIENLAHLDQLTQKRVRVYALPVPVKGLDAFPLRVIAIES